MNVSVVIDPPRVLLDRLNDNSLDIVYFLDKRISDPRWIKVLEEPEDIVFAASLLFTRWQADPALSWTKSFPILSAHRKSSQLPSYFRSVSGCLWKAYLFLSGNWKYGLSSSICCGKMQASPCFPSFLVRRDIQKGRLAALDAEDFHMQVSASDRIPQG